MPSFGTWIKRTVQQAIDPDREERISAIGEVLIKALQQEKSNFTLSRFSDRFDWTIKDIHAAARKAYVILLERAWRDGRVVDKEKKTLAWAASKLEISKEESTEFEQKSARQRFAVVLAQAMDDGFISDEEADRLREIAYAADMSLSDFMASFFQAEGEDFVRGVFAACTQDGVLADHAWEQLMVSAQRLGVTRESVNTAILPQATRFLEHVLADAKSDDELSDEEERQLLSLVQKFSIASNARTYFLNSIEGLRIIREAKNGKLPISEHPKGANLRAGELVHFHKRAVWNQLRITKAGEAWEAHRGFLTITDNRIHFSAETKSFDLRFGRIVRLSGHTGRIRLSQAGKPESVIDVEEDEPIAFAVLEAAVALVNQTRRADSDHLRTRYIPREVRQRVWQKFGGRCAECRDGQYLEFDHVIPVAKGGSNAEQNVQLLCRKCNLKKSAFI